MTELDGDPPPEPELDRDPPPEPELDRLFDAHRRRQAALGLELTPAERLRWLEQTMATMRRWLGRARERDPRGG
jgi:hypothetical protein